MEPNQKNGLVWANILHPWFGPVGSFEPTPNQTGQLSWGSNKVSSKNIGGWAYLYISLMNLG
jgi:hypothetical protein